MNVPLAELPTVRLDTASEPPLRLYEPLLPGLFPNISPLLMEAFVPPVWLNAPLPE